MKKTKPSGCPYARGTDTLKLHYLFMSTEDAKKMDQEIANRRDPVCGKPVHPGSCMCKEHLRFSRGYNLPALPYPNGGAVFTCIHSPDAYDSDTRWIVHDINGHFCAEFEKEDEAKATVDKWIACGADRVTIRWEAPPEDADDSDRGTYYIGVKGTKSETPVRCGWHSMEAAAEESAKLRNILFVNQP